MLYYVLYYIYCLLYVILCITIVVHCIIHNMIRLCGGEPAEEEGGRAGGPARGGGCSVACYSI